MWDDWHAIESAQAKADAESHAAPQPAAPEPPEPPAADPEAAAAVVEAERLSWPHPIAPTTALGRQPTNADGSRRKGWWRGTEWVDRPEPPPIRRLDAVRTYLQTLRDLMHKQLDETDLGEKPPWER